MNLNDLVSVLELSDIVKETAEQMGVRIELHQVKYLALIAGHAGITQPELARAVGSVQGVVSRNLSVLSNKGAQRSHGPNRKGLGFVRVEREGKANHYYLTDAGRDFLRLLHEKTGLPVMEPEARHAPTYG